MRYHEWILEEYNKVTKKELEDKLAAKVDELAKLNEIYADGVTKKELRTVLAKGIAVGLVVGAIIGVAWL